MVDELIDDSEFLNLPFPIQTELISKYCNGIQEKILRSSSMAEAQNIADEHCLKFHDVCSSAVLRNAATEFVQNLISQKWIQ